MVNSAINLYAHLIAKDKLPFQKKITVSRGTFLKVVHREKNNDIFSLSKTGKEWQKAIEGIQKFGRFALDIISDEPTYILFKLKPQSFIPIDWVLYF